MTDQAINFRHIVSRRYGFKNLLFWLLVYLIVGPFLERVPFAHTVLTIFLTVVLFSAIYAVNRNRRVVVVAVVMMVLALIPMWLAKFHVVLLADWVEPAMLALYLGFLVYSFISYLLSVRKVDTNVICASLCSYLMVGLLWGTLFVLLETVVPGSFSGGLLDEATGDHMKFRSLVYFSFVTISTLGYGDILPTNESAMALCQSEAIIGQFFTVVLVARLVAVQVAQSESGESEDA